MKKRVVTYKQDRPKEWLLANPHETWRCDIFPEDGSDHHGVGETEADAIFRAAIAYKSYTRKRSNATDPSNEAGV